MKRFLITPTLLTIFNDDGEEFNLPIYPLEYHGLVDIALSIAEPDSPDVFICFGGPDKTVDDFIYQVKYVVMKSRQAYPEWLMKLFYTQPKLSSKEEKVPEETGHHIFAQA